MRRDLGGFLYYFKLVVDLFHGVFIGSLGLIYYYYIKHKNNKNKYLKFNYENSKENNNDNNTPEKTTHSKLSKFTSVNLEKLKKFSKKERVSINDLIVYSTLQAFKRISPESEYIRAFIPVGFSNLPKKPEEVKIYNRVIGYIEYVDLKNMSSIQDDLNKTSKKKSLEKFQVIDILSNLHILRLIQMISILMGEFFHFYLFKAIQLRQYPEVVISNVPAQDKPIYIGNSKVTKIFSLVSSGVTNCFVSFISYNGELNLTTSIEGKNDLDPSVVSDIIKENLEMLMAESKEEIKDNNNNNKTRKYSSEIITWTSKELKESIKTLNKDSSPELPSHFYPSLFFCTLNFLIRIFLFLYLIYMNGILLGIILTGFIFFAYKYFVLYLFGLEWTNFSDKIFTNRLKKASYTIGGVSIMDDFSIKEVKQEFYEKMVMKIPKSLASMQTFLGDLYWNTQQAINFPEEKKTQILNERVKIISLEKESDLELYLEREINTQLNPFINPVEAHIIEFREKNEGKENSNLKRGCIYFKFDHSFCDGLACVNLLGFLDKDFSLEKFPAIMRRDLGGFLYYFKLVVDLFHGVFIGSLGLIYYYYIKHKNNKNKYLKFNYENSKENNNDNNTPEKTTHSKLSKFASVNLEKLKKFSKKERVSINDLIVYSTLQAFKRISPESEYIRAFIPVGFSNLPKKPEEVKIYNRVIGYIEYVNLKNMSSIQDDLNKNSKKKSLEKFQVIDILSNLHILRLIQMVSILMGEFFHFYLFKAIQLTQYPEVVISNVPAQDKPIYIGNSKVTKIFSLVSSGVTNCFVSFISYNGELNLTTSIEGKNDLDPSVVSDTIKENLEMLMAESKED